MSSRSNSNQLRLRIFAGPNGSGKSTLLQAVKEYKVNGRSIDLGHYVNADDIAQSLRKGECSLKGYRLKITAEKVAALAEQEGLLDNEKKRVRFRDSCTIINNVLKCLDPGYIEQLAQMVARYLRSTLIDNGRKLSFETVFSHPSNLDIIHKALEKGYKVYLYYVATVSPVINQYRVEYRVSQHGHNVDPARIESRYYRSLGLMKEAADLSHQAFFFDNSELDQPLRLFAHFKVAEGKKKWDRSLRNKTPQWFKTYYGRKTVKNDHGNFSVRRGWRI